MSSFPYLRNVLLNCVRIMLVCVCYVNNPTHTHTEFVDFDIVSVALVVVWCLDV